MILYFVVKLPFFTNTADLHKEKLQARVIYSNKYL